MKKSNHIYFDDLAWAFVIFVIGLCLILGCTAWGVSNYEEKHHENIAQEDVQ